VAPLDNSVATDVTAVIGCAVATGCGAVLNTARVRAGDSVVVFYGGSAQPERDYPMYVRWFQQGKLPLDLLVSQRFKLEEVNAACDALERGEILGRAILEF
jgi:Zn-dependent alcohol dehydrogenase